MAIPEAVEAAKTPALPLRIRKGVWLPALLGLAAIAHVIATRSAWSQIPLQTDMGIWAYRSSRLLEGAKLYRDLWDQKPPGLYYTFAAVEWLFGVGKDRGLLWLDAVVTALVLGVTYGVARRFASPTAAAAAVLILAILYGHRVLADWGCNCEKFAAVFEMSAVGLVVSAQMRPRPSIHSFVAGIACAAAVLYKQTGVLFLLTAFVAIMVDGSNSGWRAKAGRIALLGLGFGSVWVPVLLGLGAAGILEDFFQIVIVYDLSRVSPGAEGGRLLTTAHWLQAWDNFRLVVVLFAPACAAWMPIRPASAMIARRPIDTAPGDSPESRRGLRLVGAFALLSTLAFAVSPHGYGHYLLQAAPPAAVLAAVAFDRVARGDLSRPARIGMAVGMIYGASQLGDHFRFTFDENYVYRRAYAQHRARKADLVAAILSGSKPGHAVLLWPPDDAVSYYARRRTPLECSNATAIHRGKLDRLTPPMHEILRRLQEDPPHLVVDATGLRVDRPKTGEARGGIVVSVEAGMSLAEPPDAQHSRIEGRILSPLKEWLRANYGGQVRYGDTCTVYFRGQPWREWQDYLRQDQIQPVETP